MVSNTGNHGPKEYQFSQEKEYKFQQKGIRMQAKERREFPQTKKLNSSKESKMTSSNRRKRILVKRKMNSLQKTQKKPDMKKGMN